MLINPQTSPAPLLTKQRIEVQAVGEDVELRIGNSTLTMPYETALQLAAWLRLHGAKAKRTAGDMGRHFTAIGLLEGVR